MKILKLKLRGAIGIYEGLGLDEIEIDFTRFQSGLIAIVGQNGSGKSSFLENLHPYLQLASREGSLSNHFRLRDSFRDLTFELQGHIYRAHILIDALTAKTEAYLYRDGQPLNDGKVTTYKPEIEKLLGSSELFFRSIFSSQNSESITSLTSGKRKELFIELLGLQRYERYEALCKMKADGLENNIAGKRGKLEQIYASTSKRSVVEEELSQFESSLQEIDSSLNSLQADIETGRKIILENEHRIAEDRQKGSQIHDLGNEISNIESQQWKLGNDFKADQKQLEAQIVEADSEIQRKRKIVEHKKEIEENAIALRILRPQLKAWDERKSQLSEIEAEESNARLKHQEKEHDYGTDSLIIERDLKHLEEQKQNLLRDFDNEAQDLERCLIETRTSAGLISEVPCRAILELPGKCKLLSSAINAQNQIASLVEQIQKVRSDEYRRSNGLADLGVEYKKLQEDKRSLVNPGEFDSSEFETRKRSIGYDVAKHLEVRKGVEDLEKGGWEKLIEELRVAESIIEEKQKALNGLASQLQVLQDKYYAALEDSKQQANAKREKWETLKASMLTQEDLTSFKRHQEALAVTVEAQKEKATERSHIIGDIQFRQNMIKELDTLTVQAKELKLSLELELENLENHRLLQRACSKDGIPALELDAAGPEVSRIANDLLSSTFGSRYQITFETTKLTKDKKKQLETFEIRVYGEDGEKKIEDLSGGQRVWIETALQEAIAIYLSEKSGKELLTSYADEKDGALDPENKQHYIEMSREAFRLGRRYYTFLITQTPEIWQQVQQRIHLHPELGTIEQIL